MVAKQTEHGTRGMYKQGCRCSVCLASQRSYDQAYYLANKAKKVAQAKAWKAANPEAALASSRRRYVENNDVRRAQGRAAQARQRLVRGDAIRARQNAWFQTERGREVAAMHRQKRRGVFDALTSPYVQIIRHDPCVYCGGPAPTVDHIVPVSKGGTSEWSNLAAACKSCNSSKRDLDLLGFLSRRMGALT